MTGVRRGVGGHCMKTKNRGMTKQNRLLRVFFGDEILPSYVGITISHYKDPYETPGIMESERDFCRGSKCPRNNALVFFVVQRVGVMKDWDGLTETGRMSQMCYEFTFLLFFLCETYCWLPRWWCFEHLCFESLYKLLCMVQVNETTALGTLSSKTEQLLSGSALETQLPNLVAGFVGRLFQKMYCTWLYIFI